MVRRGGFRQRRGAALVVAALLTSLGLALPASAHSGEHPVVLASGEAVGPFVVHAWTSEGFSNGEIPVVVQVAGAGVESVSEVSVILVGSEGAVRLAPPTPANPVWTGVVEVAGGNERMVIQVTDAKEAYATSPLPFQVAVASWGLLLVLGLFGIQAIAFLFWLGGRTARVWRRQRPVTVS